MHPADQGCRAGRVLGLGCHDNNVVIVFGSSADKRDTTYIYLFNNISVRCARFDCFSKGIEVNDNQVDGRDVVLSSLLAVAVIVAAVEYTTKHLGVQRFDSSAQNRGVTRNILNGRTLVAKAFDK